MEKLVGVGIVINTIMVLLMAEVDIPREMDKMWYSLTEQRLKQGQVEEDIIVAVLVVVELSYKDRNREHQTLEMELVMVLEVVLEVVILELFS